MITGQARLRTLISEIERIDGTGIGGAPARVKHEKMAGSPFQFLRGSAQLFYADLASGLINLPDAVTTAPLTRVQGDCHLSNFGFFTEEGSHTDRVLFAANDFDDAAEGHAVWDLLRYCVSLHLAVDFLQGVSAGRYKSDNLKAGEGNKPPEAKHARKAGKAFLEAYQETCALVIADGRNRDRALDDFPARHFLAKHLAKAESRAVGGAKFRDKSTVGKMTVFENGRLILERKPDKIADLDEEVDSDALKGAFRPYLDDTILDVAQRLGAGTGSSNVRRFYFLVGPADIREHDLRLAHVVEVKAQREAAPIFHFPQLSPVNRMNPAHLTVDCQRRMVRRPDLILDEVFWEDTHWLVRSRHHARYGVDPEELLKAQKPGKALKQYAAACGETLARAHGRGDRRSVRFEQAIAGILDRHTDDLLDAAEAYAEQVLIDHRLLVEALAQRAQAA